MMVKKALLRAIGRRCDALIDWFWNRCTQHGRLFAVRFIQQRKQPFHPFR